ncbi:MAG: hypothetical protein HFG15_02315 [Bacilli bacterium]|nr:hypothetical protein [Bacilli bacterium]
MIKKRKKTVRRIALIVCVGVICSIGIGYGILSQRMDIHGTANISTKFNVVITSITENNMKDAETVGPPVIVDGITGRIETTLLSTRAKAIYDVTVKNNGNVVVLLSDILGIAETNALEPLDIVAEVSNLSKGAVLQPHEERTFQIVIKEDTSKHPTKLSRTKLLEFSLEFQQKNQ